MAVLHWRRASLKPSQRVRSDWFWAHSKNCLTSQEQAPLTGVETGELWAWTGAVAGAAAASLELPLNSPVTAWPMVWPTADPMATPPAVAAICPIRDGCWTAGWATIGVAGAACAGGWAAGAGAAAALGGGAAALVGDAGLTL